MSTEKPTPPADCECCESGCTTCVWDTYFEELKAWNAEQQTSLSTEKYNAKTKTEQNK